MSDCWVLSLFSYCFTLNTRWPFWDETILASDTLLMRNIPFILGTWGLVEQPLFADAFGFLLLALPREDSKLVSLVFVFHVYVTTMDRGILRRPASGSSHLVPPSQPPSQFNVEIQWCTKFSNQWKDLSNTDWLTDTVCAFVNLCYAIKHFIRCVLKPVLQSWTSQRGKWAAIQVLSFEMSWSQNPHPTLFYWRLKSYKET